jgi:hypothetical protein
MDPASARAIAHALHGQDRNPSGRLVTEHLERVAATVPPEARALAFVHDIVERTDVSYERLRAEGLTELEAEALELLTRADGESYELYALRIAHAPGAAGRLARAVKLADLDDDLTAPYHPRSPPYAWARRHIAIARDRRGESCAPHAERGAYRLARASLPQDA